MKRFILSILPSFFYLLLNLAIAQEDKKQKIYQFGIDDLYEFDVVSASKKTQSFADAPAIIDIITSEDISQKGFNSVAEALASVPGLFVTSDHVTFNVSVRGINGGFRASSRSLKVMINGQPISFRATSENFIGTELIPLSLIQRIEVIRGPASTLYGANAFLGIINIITKQGEEMNATEITYGNGINFNNNNITYGNFSISSGFKLNDKTSFLIGVSGGKEDRSGLKLPLVSDALTEAANGIFEPKAHDEESENDFSNPFTAYASFLHKSSFGELNTEIHFQHMDNHGKFYDGNPILNNTRVNIDNWYIKETYLNEVIKDKLTINAAFAYATGGISNKDKIDLGHPEDPTGVFIKRTLGYSSIDLSFFTDYTISNQVDVLFGVDYTIDDQDLFAYDKRDNQTAEVVVPIKEVVGNNVEDLFTNIGVYTQGIFTISDHKSITLGLRYDNHNIYGSKVSGRIVGVFAASPKWYTKYLIGTSFRAPTASQLYAPEPYSFDINIGERELAPENAAVFEFTTGVSLSKNFTLQLNTFYNLLDQLVVYTKESATSSLVPENVNEITTFGAELVAKWNFEALSGSLNFSYQNSKDIDDNDAELFPDLMINGSINYSTKNLNFNVQSYFVNTYRASQNNISANIILGRARPYNIDSYFLTDFTVTSRELKLINKKETKFSATIKNILDQDYSYPGFFKYDIPNLGRRIRISVTQKF